MESRPRSDAAPGLDLQRAILEASPNPIGAVDASGTINYVNPRAGKDGMCDPGARLVSAHALTVRLGGEECSRPAQPCVRMV